MNAPAILLSPLNWGLGHASRLIPLIDAFLEEGCKVTLAASGKSKIFLEQYFPQLEMLQTPHFEIHYKLTPWLDILRSTPRFLNFVMRDHHWLDQLLKQRNFDVIISDNRYGFRSKRSHSILVSHQLNPGRNVLSAAIFAKLINKFDGVWIPDIAGPGSLSGALSRNQFITVPKRNLGIYSRIKKISSNSEYQFSALLSGPEHQRAKFEAAVQELFESIDGKTCIIRGVVDGVEDSWYKDGIFWKNFSSGKDTTELLSKSETIICRSGYSSLLDLGSLGKPAILVPTPGQPEQIYLAKRMKQKGWFAVSAQSKISTEEKIIAPPPFEDHHKAVVAGLVQSLNKN